MLAFQRDRRPHGYFLRIQVHSGMMLQKPPCHFLISKNQNYFKSPRGLHCNSTHHRHTEANETHNIQLIACTNFGHCAEVQPLSQASEADKCTPQPTGEPEISSSGYTCTQLKILFSWLMNDKHVALFTAWSIGGLGEKSELNLTSFSTELK